MTEEEFYKFIMKWKKKYGGNMTEVYKKQIGGAHYKSMKIQPAQFINENNLPFAEGNAIKYICRHRHKGEVQDLEKAKHYIDMIIERDYGDHAKPLPHGFTLTEKK